MRTESISNLSTLKKKVGGKDIEIEYVIDKYDLRPKYKITLSDGKILMLQEFGAYEDEMRLVRSGIKKRSSMLSRDLITNELKKFLKYDSRRYGLLKLVEMREFVRKLNLKEDRNFYIRFEMITYSGAIAGIEGETTKYYIICNKHMNHETLFNYCTGYVFAGYIGLLMDDIPFEINYNVERNRTTSTNKSIIDKYLGTSHSVYHYLFYASSTKTLKYRAPVDKEHVKNMRKLVKFIYNFARGTW